MTSTEFCSCLADCFEQFVAWRRCGGVPAFQRRQPVYVGSTHGQSAHFFSTLSGTRLAHRTVHKTYRELLGKARIGTPNGDLPRIHDLRHTFAVRRLLDWYRRGIDVNDRLAALSTYLGHVDVSSTLIYLRPTEATLKEAAKRFQQRCPLPIPAERSCDR